MSVSANTLFHFTKFETLQKILKTQGFWPQYSLEHFKNALPDNSHYISTHIPMVCFCDLKLTQLSDTTISKHTQYFGNYGIGFKKNWGIKNKISPVSYVHKNSIASSTIVKVIAKINDISSSTDKTLVTNLGEIVKFLKPYQGNYQKGKKRKEIITYYDEREWRFIPKEQKFTVFPSYSVTKKEIQGYNKELQNKPLKFSVTDIKYIIIAKEDDKQPLANHLKSIGFSSSELTDLISKIISLKEIREDF